MSDTPLHLPRLTLLSQTLQKPLAFFDLETTAAIISLPSFGITEMAAFAVRPDGKQVSFSQLVHPGHKIPAVVTKITGIDDAMVAQEPPLPQLEPRIRYLFENTVMLGFNIRTYDMPGLFGQFERYQLALPAEVHILDLRDIWISLQKTQKGKLSEVAAHYGKPFEGAHRAMSDVMGCVHLLEEMIERHGLDLIKSFVKKFPEIKTSTELHKEKTDTDRAIKENNLKEELLRRVATGEPVSWALWMADPVLGKDPKGLSFAVNALMDFQQLDPNLMKVPEAYQWLMDHQDALLAVDPAMKLKPILEKSKELGAPTSIDYTQIKIAVLAWKALAAEKKKQLTL